MRPSIHNSLRRGARCRYFCLLAALFTAAACLRVNDFAPEKEDNTGGFSALQARKFFIEQNKDINFPCLDPGVRNSGENPFGKILVPVWDRGIAFGDHNIASHEIPLINKRNISGIFTRSGAVNVVSSLVIQKNTARDTIRQFVYTAIGYITDTSGFDGYRYFPQDQPHPDFLFSGDKSAFSGIAILSDLDGTYRYAAYYYLGKHMPVKLGTPDCSKTPLFSLKLYAAPEKTKWAGGFDSYFYCYSCHQNTLFYGGVCSLCGKGNEELGEIVIYPPDSGGNYE